MRTIKMTRKEAQIISDNAGWTPDTFETSHGFVTIPGPPDDDDYWLNYEDGHYTCGCCSCCGCDCDSYNEYSYMYFDEEEPE